jgi:nucleotide-binding universal stress UspA family protein
MPNMFRKILCPVFFDDARPVALEYARHLAQQDGATVYLLHVVPTDEFHLHSKAYRPEEAGGADVGWAERVARERLSQVAKESFDGVACETLTRVSGDPTEAILRVARELGVDLLVIATHGRTGLARLLRRSVAERAVREATCPVLTTKGGRGLTAPSPFRKILVPVDIGEEPGRALRLAARMAERSGGTVFLLHVVPTEEIYLFRDVYRPDESGGPSLVRAEKAARERLAEIARAHLGAAQRETLVHVSDDPERTILEVEQDLGPDLLVMATRGVSGLLHVLLGSLTEKLVRDSSCPVLSLRE